MEALENLYLKAVDSTAVFIAIAAVLLAAGVVASGLQDTIFVVSVDLQDLVLEGNLLFGVFLATSVAVVYAGWRFDNQPGRAAVIALISLVMGSLINTLFSMAAEGGWLPAWFGVLLGAWMMILYGAWKIQARVTLVVIGLTIYSILTTSFFFTGFEPSLSAPVAVGLLAVGLLAFVMTCLIGERVIANIATRRDAPEISIREGAKDGLPMILAWGAVCVAAGLPATIAGTGLIRTMGMLTLVGAGVCVVAGLAFPAFLIMVKGGAGVSRGEPAKPARRRKK